MNQILLTTVAVLALSIASFANVTKLELRSEINRENNYLVLCALTNRKLAFVAGLEGTPALGYRWSFSRGSYWSMGAVRTGDVPVGVISTCVNSALTTDTHLLSLSVNKDVFSCIADLVNQNFPTERLVTAVVGELGLKAPTFPASVSAAEMIADLTIENALPSEFSRLASDWEPPTLRPTFKMPVSIECGDAGLTTGSSEVKCIRRSALLRLYQALADAESRPWIHYDLELFIENNSLVDVVAFKTKMQTDPPTRRGEVASVFVVQDKPFSTNFIDLLDGLLTLPSRTSKGPSTLGIALWHPLLGEPRAWVAAATSPSICYWDAGVADAVAQVPSLSNAIFVGALVRSSSPRYPADHSIFNSNAPVLLSSSLPADPALTRGEAKWVRYRANIRRLQEIIAVRSSSYSGLSASAINKRKAYRKEVSTSDAVAAALRDDFAVREFGWDQYINNKNFDIHQRAVYTYDRGRATLYAIAAENAKAVKLRQDLQPVTLKQLEQYKTFASDSYVSKMSTATRFDENLPVSGTVCVNPEGDCASGNPAVATIEVSLGATTQQRFNNVVDVGRITTAKPQDGTGFGSEPADAICVGTDGSGADKIAGNRTLELKVMNRGQNALIRIAQVGSRMEAHWVDTGGLSDEYKLKTDQAATLRIDVVPQQGYEDLNIVYLLGDGDVLGTITVEYSQTAEARYRSVEVDSGDLASGNAKSYSELYAIGVGPQPVGYSFMKACMWLTGDRRCNEWSTCKWSQHDENGVIARFSMQGNEDKTPSWAWSRGHLRAVYELRPGAATLR